MDFTYEAVATMIDHALLNPTLTEQELEAGCQLAVECGVASVCILPYAMQRCAELLRGSGVAASTTIGFPHGAHATSVKRVEAQQAIDDGCQELDMVVNISQVKSGCWDFVQQDVQAVIEVAHAAKKKVKVIFENCYLQDEEKIQLCEMCSELNADWIKTSTGFGSSGATIDDLKLMMEHTAEHVQVKAAGGIRDLDMLLEIRSLGVTRVGSSRTPEILDECRQRLSYGASVNGADCIF